MSLLSTLLGSYIPQIITTPVFYNRKPVGMLLDPGHGLAQYTPGKRSPDGTIIEGEWNRDQVSRLLPELRSIGIDARCIVTEDSDVSLDERVARANRIMAKEPDKAWFYLSVHLNASPEKLCDKYGWNDTACGFCAYCTTKASAASQKWAKVTVETAHRFGFKGNRSIPSEGFWRKGFKVIRLTDMPAILTESLFMTNHKEVEFLKSEKGKRTITSLHIASVCEFFGIPYAHIQG